MFDRRKTYYTFISRDRTNNDFKYELGLNIDMIPFYPKGKCQYSIFNFTDLEHIFEFISYRELIVEIKIPKDAQVYKESRSATWKANKIYVNYIEPFENKIVSLIENGADIHVGNNKVLRWASEKGYTEIVRLLLEKGADIHAENDYALRRASYYGHVETVKLLLDYKANVHADDDEALRHASYCGHLEIVKLLLEKGANVSSENDEALIVAIKYGLVEFY